MRIPARRLVQVAENYKIGQVLPQTNLQGVSITLADSGEMVRALGEHVRARGAAVPVCAVNVHTLAEAVRSPCYRSALNAAVTFLDGVPIRWLLKAASRPAPPRIHGADLMALLLEKLPDASHAFYGSTPETLNELRAALLRRWPGLKIAGMWSPPFRKRVELESDEMIRTLNSSGADILWIALGAPKQELWAHVHKDLLKIPVLACVGAAFEIHAGRFSRAPQWMQSIGLEWAWRFLQDPWRLWRRYFATNGAFLVLLARTWLRTRLNTPPAPAAPPGASSAKS